MNKKLNKIGPKKINNKSKLKIAILHFGFFYSGGGEKLALEEIKGLTKLGHKVECFAPVVDKEKCFPEMMKKVRVKPLLPQLPTWFPEREAIQLVVTSILIPFLSIKFTEFDVILGANQPGPWMAWVTSKILRKPYIVYLAQPTRMLHPRRVDLQTGFWLKNKLRVLPYLIKAAKPFIKWADEESIRGAHQVLTNGEHVSSAIKKTYSVNNTVCAAGAYPAKNPEFEVDKWAGKLSLSKKLINKPFILITNRHFPQKRFEYAIMSMPTILSAEPRASLVITGEETNYTRYLKELTRQLELESKVRFVGYVGEKDLKKLYLNAVCYVYTSPEEDFGMGIIEAMGHGAVSVAWRRGGPKYIIEGGKTGFLAKPYLISDFARQIARALTDKKLNRSIGKAAWEFVKKTYSYETHNKVLEGALINAIKKK